MAIYEDLRESLQRKSATLNADLERDGYIRRVVSKEGTDPRVKLAQRVYDPDGVSGEILSEEELCQPAKRVLLGGAGSGKSYVLRKAFIEAVTAFSPSSAAPFFLDLYLDLGSRLEFIQALNANYGGLFSRAVAEYGPGCTLFIDSLDDRLMHESPRFINDLKQLLFSSEHRLTGFVLACRRSIYSPAWFGTSSAAPEVFQVDWLTDNEYRQIITDAAGLRSFRQQCEDLGISELLLIPFDGFYLARRFVNGTPLPRSRRDCLSQRVEDSLRGTETDRSGGRSPPVSRLRELAEYLALLDTFVGFGPWTIQDVIDRVGSSVQVRERGLAYRDELAVLLDRPLFVRSGDRFSFVHQLYREYLTAQALARVSLRKQCQLLDSRKPGSTRVATPLRGVAAFLAGESSNFALTLVQRDPLAALFAESPEYPPDVTERLLREVIEQAVREERYPWWEIPPRGESPWHALRHHRPESPDSFLRPFLVRPEEAARMWGAACAVVWGGVPGLNPELVKLAIDTAENSNTRTWAIEAVGKSGDHGSIAQLEHLTRDSDDATRVHALSLYRSEMHPSPGEYLERLASRIPDGVYDGDFRREAREFGRSLSENQLSMAFEALMTVNSALSYLRDWVQDGLFERAAEVGFEDVPMDLVIRALNERADRRNLGVKPVHGLLRRYPRLAVNTWKQWLSQGECGPSPIYTQVGLNLLSCAAEEILDDLPEVESVGDGLRGRISLVLRLYVDSGPGDREARIKLLRAKSPGYIDESWFRQAPPVAKGVDLLEEKARVLEVLRSAEGKPLEQSSRLLSLIEIGLATDRRLTLEQKTEAVLGRLPRYVLTRVLSAFRDFVRLVNYQRSVEEDTVKRTRIEGAVPFWVLRNRGEVFSATKCEEIASCYACDAVQIDEEQRWDAVIRELKAWDLPLWRSLLFRLLDQGSKGAQCAMNHLAEAKDPSFVSRLGEDLSRGKLPPVFIDEVLKHWLELRPTDWADVLKRCYEELRRAKDDSTRGASAATAAHMIGRDPWIKLLFALMAENDDWAWQEFDARLRANEVPRQVSYELLKPLDGEQPDPRIRTLADWYAMERENEPERADNDLGRFLLGLIVRCAGQSGASELCRVRGRLSESDRAYVNYAILQIEDKLLNTQVNVNDPGQLLDSILSERFFLIRDEKDLFEAVCLVIEEVQSEFRSGIGVAGYWNDSTPKRETECQNVLWPRLKDKLKNYGVSGVEERYVGPDRADFCVMLPRRGQSSLEVFIEIKVARKGYRESELVQPVRSQLWEQYLKPTGSHYGLFLVIWFRDNDRYNEPKRWATAQELTTELESTSEGVARECGVSIKSYVLDVTSPFRKR